MWFVSISGIIRKPLEASFSPSKVIEANSARHVHRQGQGRIWLEQWHDMFHYQLCSFYMGFWKSIMIQVA